MYEYLLRLYEPVHDKVADSEEFDDVYYLDSPLNLWSYYKNQKVYGDYNNDTYNDFIDWISDCKNSSKEHDLWWHKQSNSYEKILECSKYEVQERLLELLQ